MIVTSGTLSSHPVTSRTLGNILFLTGVWHYSIMRAGFAVTPGPLVVAVIAGPAGKLAARVGFRPVLGAGALCFASGLASYVVRVGDAPNYLAGWLPGTLIVGLGIGLTFPVLSAAAVSSLPAHRFAVGSAVNQTARQVGGVIGVAVLVMVLGTRHGATDAITRFHHLWTYCAGTALLSGLLGALISRPSTSAHDQTDDVALLLVAVDADLTPPTIGDQPESAVRRAGQKPA